MFARTWLKTPPKQRSRRRHDEESIININGDTYIQNVIHRDDRILFSGYLLRPLLPVNTNGTHVKTWKEMWMVLRSDDTMSFYDDEHSTKPINSIQTQNIDVRITEEVYPDKFCFEIVTPMYVYQFMANSFEEMKEWTEILRRHSVVSKENSLIEQAEQIIEDKERQKNTLNPNQVMRESQDVRMKYYNHLRRSAPTTLRTSSQPPPRLSHAQVLSRHSSPNSPSSQVMLGAPAVTGDDDSLVAPNELRHKSPNSPRIQRHLLSIPRSRTPTKNIRVISSVDEFSPGNFLDQPEKQVK
jgi:hypothetical protein